MESKSGSKGGRKASKGILGLRMIVSPSIQLQQLLAEALNGLEQEFEDIRVLMQAAILT